MPENQIEFYPIEKQIALIQREIRRTEAVGEYLSVHDINDLNCMRAVLKTLEQAKTEKTLVNHGENIQMQEAQC